MNRWWGYLHVEGTLHVKPYFSAEDLLEARQSPFVAHSRGPWECSGIEQREEALEKLKAALKS